MPERELKTFRYTLDRNYRAGLLAKGIMPAAVVCIAARGTNEVYSVHSGVRFSGFPVIDLARVQEGKTVTHHVRNKIDRVYGLQVQPADIKLLPLASDPSPYMENIGNVGYSDIHHRMYFPVVGVTDAVPMPTASHPLETIDMDLAQNNVVAPRGEGVVAQLANIHYELLSRFTRVEPVPLQSS